MTFREEYGEAIGMILEKKYALKKENGYIEKSYKDIIKRIMSKVRQYKGRMSENEFDYLEDALLEKRIMPGGSILHSLGTSHLTSLSNCFVLPPPEDNSDSIVKVDGMVFNIEKRRGGVGTDLSLLRPEGTPVNNAAEFSSGAASFAERYSNTTLEVAQNGRRGALMLTMDYKHKDAKKFINLKTNSNKVLGANLSLRVDSNIFLKENEGLLENIALNAWKYAEPGVLFWDTIKDNPIDAMKVPRFKTISTNPCGEIPLNPFGACLLIHLNFYSYVENKFKPNARFNLSKLKTDTKVTVKFMNIVIEEELKHIQRIIEVSEDFIEKKMWKNIYKILFEGRRIGIGKLGIADMLAALNTDYGNKKVVEIASAAIKTEAIKTSLDIDIEAPILKVGRNREGFMAHPFIKETLDILPREYKDKVPANIGFITLAPTGTTSMITKTSSGMEPVFMIEYVRKRRANGEDKDYVVDENGDNWVEFKVYHEPYLDYLKANNLEGDPMSHFEKSPYYKNLAKDIDVYEKIDLQSTLQKYTDQAISVTHNVKRDFPLNAVKPLIKYAYKKKVKGFTMYREGSRSGILTENGSGNSGITIKRPKKLKCDVHNVKVDGKDWTVLIGLKNGRPYEIFALAVKGIQLKNITEAVLEKEKIKGRNQYNLISKEINIYNIISYYGSASEEIITRLVSRALNKGDEVEDILEDFEKVMLVIGSFGAAIKRVLSYYAIPKELNELCPECKTPLVKEGGCTVCKNCGYSKCE